MQIHVRLDVSLKSAEICVVRSVIERAKADHARWQDGRDQTSVVNLG